MSETRFRWAENLSPRLLKSPWWIGHIPFAFEIVGRLEPRVIVELGTYSGSSFAAFCQAAEACVPQARCYGIDLWEGDIHMGRFDDTVYRDVAAYLATHYPSIATLVRKDFNHAVHDFPDRSIDLLHIDGLHTFEAVSNDFNTWLPKMSDRGVVLFHDINVTFENTGPKAADFGVRRLFDAVKDRYPHFEFAHCWGLGVLVVGERAPASVLELVDRARTPDFHAYFERKGGEVSQRFVDLGIGIQLHDPYPTPPSGIKRALGTLQGLSRRLLGIS